MSKTLKISTAGFQRYAFGNDSILAVVDVNGLISGGVPVDPNDEKELDFLGVVNDLECGTYQRNDFAISLCGEHSMLEKILPLCRSALVQVGAVCSEIERDKFSVQSNGNSYTVSLDTADDEDDEDKRIFPERAIPYRLAKTHLGIKSVVSHTDVLEVCLFSLSSEDEMRSGIMALTTDGDNNGCEAIFATKSDGYFVLKVR